jgi:hypothetical protein
LISRGYDLLTMHDQEAVIHGHKPTPRSASNTVYNQLNVVIAVKRRGDWFQIERATGYLECGQVVRTLTSSRIGIEDNRHALDSRRHILQQLKPLTDGCRLFVDEGGDVPAGARQARDEPASDRITHNHKHDRDRPRCR